MPESLAWHKRTCKDLKGIIVRLSRAHASGFLERESRCAVDPTPIFSSNVGYELKQILGVHVVAMNFLIVI